MEALTIIVSAAALIVAISALAIALRNRTSK